MKVSAVAQLVGDKHLVLEVLSLLLDKPRTQIFLSDELNKPTVKKCLRVVKKVKQGIPLQQALGKAYFYQLPLFVNKHVLIPRFDTEVLVQFVLDEIEQIETLEPIRVIDLCTGSGCIAIAVAKFAKRPVTVVAGDISRKALRVARRNAKLNNVNIKFVCSNLTKNIHDRFDIVAVNPPYVRTSEIGIEDKTTLHEPRLALDGGEDGLQFYRRILCESYGFMREYATLAMEIGHDQGNDVVTLMGKHGLLDIEILPDIEGRSRVTIGYNGRKKYDIRRKKTN